MANTPSGNEDVPWRMTVHQHHARRSPTGDVNTRGFPRTAYPDLTVGGMEQMWLAYQMQNALVALEREYEEKVAEIWDTVPEIGRVKSELDAVSDVVENLVKEVKAHDKVRCTTSPEAVETRAMLRKHRSQLKMLKAELRALKHASYPEILSQIGQLREWRKLRTKEIRRDFAAQGLYWATYNAVLEHHNTSVKNVSAKRKNGEPADYRVRRWTREGTLAVQLQRQAGDPSRAPELLASGTGPWRNVIQIRPYVSPGEWEKMTRAQRKEVMRNGEVTFKISSTETVTIPIKLSRMLPEGADVTGVQLSRRSKAGTHNLSVAISARVPKTPVRELGPVVALHIGWRVREDASIRVATLTSNDVIKVPEQLQDYVIGHDQWAEVLFPAAWRNEFAQVEQIRSERDRMLDQIKLKLAAYLDSGGNALGDNLVGAVVQKWRSHAAMARVALKVRSAAWERPADQVVDPAFAAIETELISWYRWDKRMWQRETGKRDRLIGRRRNLYRQIAAWLGRNYRLIVSDNISLASLARATNDHPQLAAARANRVLVAPADLRSYTENAAVNYGATFQSITPVSSKLTHYTCGVATVSPEDYAASVTVDCTRCRATYDQDVNMGMLLLASVGEIDPVPVVMADV